MTIRDAIAQLQEYPDHDAQIAIAWWDRDWVRDQATDMGYGILTDHELDDATLDRILEEADGQDGLSFESMVSAIETILDNEG